MKRDIKYIIRKVIIGLLIILILSFIRNCEVSAKVNTGNFDQYEIYGISQLYMRNWSTYPSSGTDLTDSQISTISYPVNEIVGYASNSAYNIASQGFSISYSPNSRFLTGYLYSVQTVVCFVSPSTPNSVTFTSSTGTTAVNSYTRTPTYQVTGKLEVYDNYYTYGGNTHRCYLVIGLVVPSAEGAWYSLHVTSSTSFTGNIVVWGTNVSELGLYSSSIQEIIENSISSSGIATASQIQQVQSAITNQTNTINSNITSAQNSINSNIDAMDEHISGTITDDNVSGANSEVDSLLSNAAFQDSTGLTAVISTPLNFISSLSNTCSPINLTLPYFKNNTQVTLPCISSLLQAKIPTVKNLLSIVINGFIIYRILIELFYIVKSARNPEDDRIEVLDL